MSGTGCLAGIFARFLNLNIRYNRISQDAERKQKTVYFGVYSIIVSLLVGALFVLLMWGLLACVNALDGGGLGVILLYVLIAVIAIAELALFAQYLCGGLLGVIFQLRCNRRAIGWIALVVFLAATAGMIVGIIYIMGMLN